jgi:hypothetical protein
MTTRLNHRRPYEACDDIPPAELEAAYYRQNTALTEVGQTTSVSRLTGAIQLLALLLFDLRVCRRAWRKATGQARWGTGV